MFTIQQIKSAHSKVKSGADFPGYIRALKALGVSYYQTFVTDGCTFYFDAAANNVTAPGTYAELPITEIANTQKFKAGLEEHQQGKTDFPSFIKMCAVCGIEKWTVDLKKMVCTYYDKAGNEILAEHIPE